MLDCLIVLAWYLYSTGQSRLHDNQRLEIQYKPVILNYYRHSDNGARIAATRPMRRVDVELDIPTDPAHLSTYLPMLHSLPLGIETRTPLNPGGELNPTLT